MLRGGLSGREAVEIISWSDEAINEAIGAYYEQKRGTPEKDMRAALDAAVTAQEAREFPGFKEWALEGEYHRGRAEALEEAARYVEQIWAAGFGPSAVTAAIRALKEKQG